MIAPNTGSARKLTLTIDFRIISIILCLIIIGMVAAWRPWQPKADANSRTVEVTGTTTIKSEPDQYVFNPYYQFEGADQRALIDQANTKSNDIVKKLKELGVTDNNIKTSTSGYDYYTYNATSKTKTYNLSLTITLTDKAQAQKVEDYLVTTTPQGSISPIASFSESKRKQLESQARDAATKDARTKAEQNAKNLGFKIGAVKSVTDGQGFNVMPLAAEGNSVSTMALDVKTGAAAPSTSMAIQPGQNDLNYSVSVVYYVK